MQARVQTGLSSCHLTRSNSSRGMIIREICRLRLQLNNRKNRELRMIGLDLTCFKMRRLEEIWMTSIREIEMLSRKKQASEERLRIESFQMLSIHSRIQEISKTCTAIKSKVNNLHRLKQLRNEIQMRLMNHHVSNQPRTCDSHKPSEVRLTFLPKIS